MSIASLTESPRALLSNRATTIYAVLTAISFSATSSAPTPLYHFYQQTLGLSPLLVTVIFAAYAFAMLGALLTVASLSDYVGRKPMILVALLLNAAALVIFATAGSAAQLVLGRVVQGAATGIAMTTLGAIILDTDRKNGPVLNSVTAFLGLMTGSLLAGALLAFAPLPGQLVYFVLLAVTAVEALVLLLAPETGMLRRGALASIRPHASVPQAARPVILRLLPLNIAGWALGGFYLSLMPTLVAVALHIASPFVGAAVVSVLMLSAAGAVFALRSLAPARLINIANAGLALGVAVTLAGISLCSAPLLFFGTAIAGIGFGAAFSGNLRTLLPLADATDRASLLAAYFVESYVVFAVPAIIAGLVAPMLGLVATAYFYGAVLIAFTAVSALATRRSAREAAVAA